MKKTYNTGIDVNKIDCSKCIGLQKNPHQQKRAPVASSNYWAKTRQAGWQGRETGSIIDVPTLTANLELTCTTGCAVQAINQSILMRWSQTSFFLWQTKRFSFESIFFSPNFPKIISLFGHEFLTWSLLRTNPFQWEILLPICRNRHDKEITFFKYAIVFF